MVNFEVIIVVITVNFGVMMIFKRGHKRTCLKRIKGGGVVINQFLFFLIENNKGNLLITHHGKFHGFLNQTSLSFAVGYIFYAFI